MIIPTLTGAEWRAREAAAKALYESRNLLHAPKWEQLGDVTRSVWFGYLSDQSVGAPPNSGVPTLCPPSK